MQKYIVSYRKTTPDGGKCWICYPNTIRDTNPQDAIADVMRRICYDDPNAFWDYNTIETSDGATPWVFPRRKCDGIKELFAASVFGRYDGPTIQVEFTDRESAIYPASVLDAMTQEKNVSAIIDAETGELLFYR